MKIKITKKYGESCQSEFWQEVFKKETEYLLTELKGYQEILSVGCGPACIERVLQENGFNVVGLDVSKETLEGAPDNIRRVIGSAEEMKFSNATFDAVVYIASLQFINNYEQAIQETARVLKPNGKLIIMLLNPMSIFVETKKSRAESYMNKIKHLHIAPIEGVIRKRFTVIKAEYYLGIKGKHIFESQNPRLAALYIIQGVLKK